MRSVILLICALTLFLPLTAEAYDLLILKSQHSPVYDEILKGFRSSKRYTERVLTLSDYAEVDVRRIVKEDRPTVVVTLGDVALETSRKINQVPIVSLMSSNYRQRVENQSNVSGIDIFIAPERYLNLFKQIKVQRVGVIYSKTKTGAYVQRAQKIAAKFGIALVLREVTSPKETFSQLATLKGNVDALWMLPDSLVVSPVTVEGFSNFSIDQKVPLVSYASAYLSHGASAVIELDRNDLGAQASELVSDIMDGQSPNAEAIPRKSALRFNHTVMRRLGISPDLLDKVQQNWD